MTGSPRLCPVCQTTLSPMLYEGTTIDVCPSGCGRWLDLGELRRIVAATTVPRSSEELDAAIVHARTDTGASVVADSARDPRPCVVCGQAMEITEYPGSGVALDECMAHGTWLDQEELTRVEAYGEAMRRQMSGGAAGDRDRAVFTVAGLDVPADLLASIGRA